MYYMYIVNLRFSISTNDRRTKIINPIFVQFFSTFYLNLDCKSVTYKPSFSATKTKICEICHKCFIKC